MPSCDLCKQNKPDVQVRPLLRLVDASGQRTRDPIQGMLCDSCCAKVQQVGSPEHVSLLTKVSRRPRD
jgi:hypothetical protein